MAGIATDSSQLNGTGASVIETVFDELKNLCQVEHTRHRSHGNFMVNLMTGIIAYCLALNKPRLPLTSSAPACR